MSQWVNITKKHAKAKAEGTPIKCPHCGHVSPVYHFAWSACICLGCKALVDKLDFLIEKN